MELMASGSWLLMHCEHEIFLSGVFVFSLESFPKTLNSKSPSKWHCCLKSSLKNYKLPGSEYGTIKMYRPSLVAWLGWDLQ